MGNKQPKQTPEEIAKENKRAVTRSIRHLEREKKKMEREESAIIADIKKLALKGLHVSLHFHRFRGLLRSERRISPETETV